MDGRLLFHAAFILVCDCFANEFVKLFQTGKSGLSPVGNRSKATVKVCLRCFGGQYRKEEC